MRLSRRWRSGRWTGDIVLAREGSGLEYTVLASVSIGGRTHEWAEVGLVAPGRLAIPEAALMVDLQEAAVSQLVVIVEARRLADRSGLLANRPRWRLLAAASTHSVYTNWASCDYLHGIIFDGRPPGGLLRIGVPYGR